MVRVPVTLAINEHVANVLVQCATECHVEYLQAPANRQERFVLSYRFAHDGELEVIVLRHDAIHRVTASRVAVTLRVNIATALNEHAIACCDEVCCFCDMLDKWRNSRHDSTGASYRPGVQHTIRIAVTTHPSGIRRQLAGQQNSWCQRPVTSLIS